MRVFVTGASGFAGSHLVDALLAENHEVYCLMHEGSGHQPLPDHPACHAVAGDLLDLSSLRSSVREVQPQVIYHLAGQASPKRSWDDPAFTIAVNSGGTANLLESARNTNKPRVVVVTSAEIHGPLTAQDLPITERTPARPRHPYGISKWAAGQLVRVYWQRYQLPAIEARPLNHVGPRQALGFVVPDFASQVATIKLGRRPPKIIVGNLDSERDFTDVRDVVRAYQCLASRGRPGESYLICSGRAVSISSLLETLIDLAGIQVEVQSDPNRIRSSDTPRLVGSYAKILHETGWHPEIDLKQSLSEALEYWMEELS